jgi:hypothetical protein
MESRPPRQRPAWARVFERGLSAGESASPSIPASCYALRRSSSARFLERCAETPSVIRNSADAGGGG